MAYQNHIFQIIFLLRVYQLASKEYHPSKRLHRVACQHIHVTFDTKYLKNVWRRHCPVRVPVVRFPAKLGLAGYLLLPLDILPRQRGFGGLSRAVLGHFAPPKGFWRVISAQRGSIRIQKKLHHNQKSRSGYDAAPIYVAVSNGLLGAQQTSSSV